MDKQSKANVVPIRQKTQFSCVAASLTMSMKALGFDCDEETVNKVLGARPMVGASWEQCMAAAQHYGFRCTLTTPSTLAQVKAWTDAGTPVIIGWNTGNEWSHASVIFDVDEENVMVADPNITDPAQLVRVVPHKEFYEKWFEKSTEGYKIRRPAMAVEREISKDGRQMVASAPRFTATLEYSGPDVKVFGVYDQSSESRDSVGDIVFDRKSKTYESRIGSDQPKKRIGLDQSHSEQTGLKRALMNFERDVRTASLGEIKDVWSPTKGLLTLNKPQSLLDVRNKINQFCIPKFFSGSRTLSRPKGTVWYSFHWSNAQMAWDVIREKDSVVSVTGADLLVAVAKSAIDSTTGKPFTLRDLQVLARFLREHGSYSSSMEGGSYR